LITFDAPTGLPSTLFKAPLEQVEVRSDPIHRLTSQEWAFRSINVSLNGGNLADNVKRSLASCKTARARNSRAISSSLSEVKTKRVLGVRLGLERGTSPSIRMRYCCFCGVRARC
jgi:hypothetical protein